MPFWIAVFWFCVTLAISYTIGQLLMKKPHIDDLKAGKMDITNSEEGRVYPVIFGTPKRIDDATIAWWGDVKSVEIKKKVSDGGWFHGDTYATIGYKYYVGMLLELCHGLIDGVKQFFVGDNLVWPNPDDPEEFAADGATTATLDVPKLFGGQSSGGGVTGVCDIQYGTLSQTPNEYLREQLAATFEGALQGIHVITSTSLTIDGVTPNKVFHADDTLIIAGNIQRYTITADATANGSGVLIVTITPGLVEQGADNAVTTIRQDSYLSASRGLVSVILKQVYIGTQPYVQPWSFICKRTNVLDDGSPQWYIAKAVINTLDINPAHIIRECLTNSRWGMGFSTGLCDDTLWQAVADKLYSENFGLSAIWDGQKELIDFIQDVLSHINALLYQDLRTGQFVLKLVRDDYTPASLTIYSTSDIISVDNFVRPSLGLIPDCVNVNYWNLKDNKTAVMPDHDIALMDAQGGKSVIYDTSMPFITNKDLAAKIAAREARQISSMAATMKITAKRTMATIKPGDVFKLTWPMLGIIEMIIRVLKVNYGSLQNGEVIFECMEDTWSTETAIYVSPPESGWVDPISAPVASPYRKLMETPFYTLAKNMGLANALSLVSGAGYLMVGAVRSSSDALNYELLVRDAVGLDFYSEGYAAWTGTGFLTASLPLNAADAVVQLEDTDNLDTVIIGGYALIDSEFVKVKDVDTANEQVTIARGVLDSVPAAHSAGARIMFLEASKIIAVTEYASGALPAAKILSRTGKGEMEEADAPTDIASAFNSRQARAYPPGNFKVNAVSYPASFTGQPTLSWSHRDRTQQVNSITEHSAASIGPETSTTYTIKIYDEDNVLRRTVTGLTGTSYEYTEAFERADCGLGPTDPLNTQLRFVLYSVRSGLDSWQSYDITVPRT